MRYLYVFAVVASSLFAQEGATIYRARCSQCHDSPAPRVPSLATIRAMSAGAITRTLTTGVMKTQASGLSPGEMNALIRYIAPAGVSRPLQTSSCASTGAFMPDASREWSGWSPAPTNSRFQDAASAGLTAADLPRLKLAWAFNLGDVTEARSQPVVAGGRVFIGSATGAFYALDASTGCAYWSFQAASPIRGGGVLGESKGAPAVFLSDTTANVYALNAQTGDLIWKAHQDGHRATMATATPAYYKGVVYQPFSSFEETLAGNPKFPCCTFRGSIAALDASTGEKLWQTFTIAEPPKPTGRSPAGTQQYGPSGAAVWSTPTIDEQRGALYLSTGDNYSDPPGNTSDAILALDLETGKVLWSAQLTVDDAFNNACGIPIPGNCPQLHGSDSDFGQPPILVPLAHGHRALVIAQKSGMAYAIDPDAQGKLLWRMRAGKGGVFGGSMWGSASDGEKVYVAISGLGIKPVRDPKSPAGYRLTIIPSEGGGLHALDLSTGRILWSAPIIPCAASRIDCSPAQSAAVTAIPGAVFSGSVDGRLRAYSTATGKILWDTDTERDFDTVNGKPAHGGSIDAAGPAIAGGMMFVTSGYGQWGGMPGNVLLAFTAEKR